MTKEFFVSLMVWVAQAMGVPPAEMPEPPTVEMVSGERVFHIRFPGQEPGQHQVQGSYLPGTIFIRDDLEEIVGQSVVVHELVHHFQEMGASRHTYKCVAEQEREAYLLQEKFLRERGFALMATTDGTPSVGMSALWFVGLTNCPTPNLARAGTPGP